MRRLAALLLLATVSACASPAPTAAPSPTQPPSQSSTPPPSRASPTAAPTGSAVAVEGGCGGTQVFAGPGPDASLGLADNPWAAAAPGSAGIVAYFWHAPPAVLRASGAADSGDKVLWVVHGAPGVPLTVVAHTRYAGPPVVRLTVPAALSPAGNYPSLIALPSPGCWNFDLSVGGASATLDILVAPRSS